MTKKPSRDVEFSVQHRKTGRLFQPPTSVGNKTIDERQNAFMYSTTKDRRQRERETNENAKQPFRGARALFPKYAINTLRRSASKERRTVWVV